MKKWMTLGACCMILAFSTAAWALTFVNIGTGGVGGTYFPLGGSMAEVLTKADIGVKATAQTTAASKENCRLLAKGKAELGMSMGSTLYQAYTGTGAFEEDGKLPLQILFNMYPAPQHLVTVEGSGINSFEDIKGKRVSLGAAGGGDQVLTRMILDAAGIDPDADLDAAQLTQPEAVMALKDGNIDAAFFNFAAPGAAVMEIAAVRDIKLISLPEDLVAKVVEKNPFLMPYTIKAGTYSSFTEDCHIIADGNYMVVNSNMKEDLAYNLVKTLLENRENFMEVTEQAKHFVPEEASRGIIPFHPGAVKYFTEQGVTMQ
ncbi:MAG TPA: TAXI family TRAP transporter solute-binding subunit [Synergistaceae bacterium]|nr:TAXI family TRAP transporter solute-binding subunit [Synergistaceae bacterium]HPJ25185.1 TAXI family TRAP transporter solute-binding subunit [Synergistaceae bacterium]HPQ36743.1 TAXI family TRAP transporter solute-binding subunit [Synergistaceae bacterium]